MRGRDVGDSSIMYVGIEYEISSRHIERPVLCVGISYECASRYSYFSKFGAREPAGSSADAESGKISTTAASRQKTITEVELGVAAGLLLIRSSIR
jgi:hypothetical protein